MKGEGRLGNKKMGMERAGNRDGIGGEGKGREAWSLPHKNLDPSLSARVFM